MTETQTKAVATSSFASFKNELSLALPSIAPMLPKHIKQEKFEAVVITAVTINPELLTVDRRSLFNACRSAAELGLSLNPALGEADILKQYDKRAGGYVARFSPRFGGLMKLGRQSGMLRTIYAHTVRERDNFDIELGTDKNLKHKPASGDRGPLTGVYCVWVLSDGTKDFEYMDREQVLAVRSRSSAKTKEGTVVGPWVTDEEEMWRKTVVRRASKYWPRSPEVNAMLRATAGEDMDTIEADAAEMAADFGMAMDVTDTASIEPDPAPPAPQQAAAAQVADLETRLGSKPPVEPTTQPRAKRLRVIAVPERDDAPDWPAYATLIQNALSEAEDYKRVLATNGVALKNLAAARPDMHEAVMAFANTLFGEE